MNHSQHGGDIFRAARELGRPAAELLDFSASINPLGMPPTVLEAARAALPAALHYPEADAASLTAALALHHALPAPHFLPGNGSTDLLYLLPRVLAPRRALLVTPAFGEYERSLRQAGTAIDLFPLSPADGFRLDPERLLRRLEPGTDLILLANPGNPTGAAVEPAVVEGIVGAVRGQAVVMVDEAFVDFTPGRSVIDRVPDLSNLYVLRSLTKFYAIPGLRAGYLAGPARGIARLAAAAPPWPLSVPALAAAEACLAAAEFRERTLALIPELRRRLAEGLTALGLAVFPSEANFLLVRLEKKGGAAAVTAALRKEGILVRDCGNFASLEGEYLRLAVRTETENGRLISALSGQLS